MMIEESNKHIETELNSLLSSVKKRSEDNSLLDALKQVIESNAEYARGVSTLLDANLEREILLNNLVKEIEAIKKIAEKNQNEITTHNREILRLLEKLKLDEVLTEKLQPLYMAANLQPDGKQYNPTDKLVIAGQRVMSSRLFAIFATIIIWQLAKLIFGTMKLWL